jgi:hypothetical protein
VKAVIKVRLKLKVYSERRNLEKVKTREIMSQPGTDNLGCDSVRLSPTRPKCRSGQGRLRQSLESRASEQSQVY